MANEQHQSRPSSLALVIAAICFGLGIFLGSWVSDFNSREGKGLRLPIKVFPDAEQKDHIITAMTGNGTHISHSNGTSACQCEKHQHEATIAPTSKCPVSNSSTDPLSAVPQKPPLPLTHPQWCPGARCTNTDLCSPCQRRFLILISTPRSASTTLTWMLDALPGIRMAGENENHLKYVRDMHDHIVDNKVFKGSTNKKASWGHNAIPPQTFSCLSQHAFEAINPPALIGGKTLPDKEGEATEIVGFKTIRFMYGLKTPKDIQEQIKFVKDNFPCTRIIININSDLEQRADSLKKNFHQNVSEDDLKVQNDQLRSLAPMFAQGQALVLDKAEWTANITKLNEAVSWLGFSSACHFQELLEFNTKGYGNTKTKFHQSRDECQKLPVRV